MRNYLISFMMKVNFLKRLESSVHAFAITMGRTVAKIETLEQRLRDFKATQEEASEGLQSELFEDDDDEDVGQAFSAGGAMTFDLRHMKVDEWLSHLGKDKQQLSLLENSARAVTVEQDAKLAELRRIIEDKARSPNDRVAVFAPRLKALDTSTVYPVDVSAFFVTGAPALGGTGPHLGRFGVLAG